MYGFGGDITEPRPCKTWLLTRSLNDGMVRPQVDHTGCTSGERVAFNNSDFKQM